MITLVQENTLIPIYKKINAYGVSKNQLGITQNGGDHFLLISVSYFMQSGCKYTLHGTLYLFWK